MIIEMENVMKFDNNQNLNHKESTLSISGVRSKTVSVFITIVLLCTFTPLFVGAQSPVEVQSSDAVSQTYFATAEAAADKLYNIVAAKDSSSVAALFGAQYIYLLPLDEIDEQDKELFINGWKKSHTLITGEKDEMLIAVGTGGWTFPIPLRKDKEGWFFDTLAGADVVQTRRIGRNELSTMQAALAYYDAQKEYSEQDRNGDGVLEYAQKFVSSPGKKDGLYWDVNPGEPLSPLGSLFSGDTSGGAYHGYSYKILTAQGDAARGGAYNYLMGQRMRSGFALLAWPADYGDSGVMSFLINHDGIIYESNLGLDTAQTAAQMTQFNPGDAWSRVEENL